MDNEDNVLPEEPTLLVDRYSREGIKLWIKRKLGYPVVNIELTDDQLEDSIDEALDEVAPWVVQPEYITVPFSNRVDLKEYSVAYVINVFSAESRTNQSGVVNGGVVDIFSANQNFGSASYRDALYVNLEQAILERTRSTMKGDISFKWIKPNLYVDMGSEISSSITIEYSPTIKDVKDLTDELYFNFIKKFALCFARETLSDIRGKFRTSNSVVELDAEEQSSKSSAELERLREELKSTVSTNFMID